MEAFHRGFLDLAAIGTITDCMPLLGENRIIVKHGLDAMANTKKPGLRCLIAEAGYAEKDSGRPRRQSRDRAAPERREPGGRNADCP